MSKKRKTTVAKDLVRGMKEFTTKLKSGKPIKATRMHKVDGRARFDSNGRVQFFTTDKPLSDGWTPLTIYYTEDVEL